MEGRAGLAGCRPKSVGDVFGILVVEQGASHHHDRSAHMTAETRPGSDHFHGEEDGSRNLVVVVTEQHEGSEVEVPRAEWRGLELAGLGWLGSHAGLDLDTPTVQ
jgi:hypothetical protein